MILPWGDLSLSVWQFNSVTASALELKAKGQANLEKQSA